MAPSPAATDEPRSSANASPYTHEHAVASPRSSSTSLNSEAGSSNHHNHRASFADNFRSHPPSPRTHRHPSFTQSAVQDLLSHPPNKANPKFAGRDWTQIPVSELVRPGDVKMVDWDTSVEEATKQLIDLGAPNVILIRDENDPKAACSTFDYSHLNAYLLAVIGLARPEPAEIALYDSIARQAREHAVVTLRDAKRICRDEPLITAAHTDTLAQLIEAFGSGVHRIVVVKKNTKEVVGVLSQLRVLDFFWENGMHFSNIEPLYTASLKDLAIGTRQIIAINGEKPVTDALRLMHSEALTSVAVVDSGLNVVGNISTVDTKSLTRDTSLPLLQAPCSHFTSVILSERGVEMGKDSFPVFHVNPYSSLAHTVAKLCATRSHRMWVVDAASPSPSTPGTPALVPSVYVGAHGGAPASPSLSASAPGARLSGRLSGVVSLTDILHLFARHAGLHPAEPNAHREWRRRSSSSSLRPSMDSLSRSSLDLRR